MSPVRKFERGSLSNGVSRSRFSLLLFAFFTIFIDTVGYQIVIPTIPIFANTLGISESRIGVIYASYGISSLLLYMPFGYLVDRVGKKYFLTGGLLMLGVSTVLFAHAETFTGLLTSRIVQGISASSTWAAVIPLVAGAAKEKGRGLSMSGISIAYLMGGVIGPALGGLGSVKSPFLWFSAAPFVLSLVSLLVLDNDYRPDTRAEIIDIKVFIFNHSLMMSCIAIFAGFFAIGALEILVPLYLHHMNVRRLNIGGLFALIGILSALYQPLCGWWSDKRGRIEPIVVGVLTLSVVFPFVTALPALIMIILWSIPLSFGLSAALAPTLPLISDSVKKKHWGFAYGLYNTFFSVGLIVGSLSCSAIAERYGWSASTILISIVTFTSGIVIITMQLKGQRGS